MYLWNGAVVIKINISSSECIKLDKIIDGALKVYNQEFNLANIFECLLF